MRSQQVVVTDMRSQQVFVTHMRSQQVVQLKAGGLKVAIIQV